MFSINQFYVFNKALTLTGVDVIKGTMLKVALV